MTDAEHLARRVETEEPSEELRDAVQDATNTVDRLPGCWGNKGERCSGDDPLTDLNASVALMPPEWSLTIYEMAPQIEEGEETVTKLLPAEPDKDGSYWIAYDPTDPERARVFEWVAADRVWCDDRQYPGEQWLSPKRAYADGCRLAWPHPIPTPSELKSLQKLTERQPIGTAPKDDIAVDLWEQYTDNGKLVWMRWPDCKWIDGKWQYMDHYLAEYLEVSDVTHWTAIVA